MGTYAVYDVVQAKSIEMTYNEVCKAYPNAALFLFNVDVVSYIIVYKGDKRVAVISKVKEGK